MNDKLTKNKAPSISMRFLTMRDHFASKERSSPPDDWIVDYFNEEGVKTMDDLTPARLQEALAVWRYECADAMLLVRGDQ